MNPEIIRTLINLGMKQTSEVTRQQFKDLTKNTEPLSMSAMTAFSDWMHELGVGSSAINLSARDLEDTPAHNDYLIYMWSLSKRDKWLNMLHSNLDSHVLDVAASALWASESLRETNPIFKAAWDRIPLCKVQLMHRANAKARGN
jgi:hypothetical protein